MSKALPKGKRKLVKPRTSPMGDGKDPRPQEPKKAPANEEGFYHL